MKEIIKDSDSTKEYKILHVQKIDEIREVIYAFNKVFEPPLSERISDLDVYAEKLYNNAFIFVAEEKNDYIGFIAFYANDKNMNVAYLSQIAVQTKAQNRNVGKLLLDLCTETSKNNGMS